MEFRYFLGELQEIHESFNTPVQINNIENDDGYKYLYFNINDKKFRAVIETVGNESSIIFEQEINGVFTYEGIQNNLSNAESLSLFSTLISLKPYLSPSVNYIFTDSRKKLRLYLKILKTLGWVKSVNYTEDKVPFIIGFGVTEKIESKPNEYKYKFWK